jgi:hypothetical protein
MAPVEFNHSAKLLPLLLRAARLMSQGDQREPGESLAWRQNKGSFTAQLAISAQALGRAEGHS